MVKTKIAIATLLFGTFSVNADFANQMAGSRQHSIEQGRSAVSDEFIRGLIEVRESSAAKVTFIPANVPNEQQAFTPTHSSHETFVILVSDSMGEATLKQLFASLSYRDDVQFAIRGLLPTEKTITDAGKRIIKLVKDMNPVPNVTLDPRYFKEVQAEFAPQILMYRGDELVLNAIGLTNPTYIKDQYEKGNRGDLGKFGDSVSISERDLTEIILERAAKLDAEQLKTDAKNRYWDNVQFLSLPEAKETQIREFEPLLINNEEIVSPENKIIAYSGQRYNLLEQLPFTQRLVIFDAMNPAHIEYVKSLPATNKRTKFITTQYDRRLKWDAVKTVEREIGAPVFQLQTDIIDAFNVRVIPSVVTADNQRKVFLISETKLGESGQNNAE